MTDKSTELGGPGKAVTAERGGILAARLLESDRAYFRAGASVERVGGVSIVHLEGLVRLPSACVLEVGRDADLAADLERAERRLTQLGCPQSRLYLHDLDSEHAAFLRERGYRSRVEVGLIRGVSHVEAGLEAPRVELRAVVSSEDWAAKLRLHQWSGRGADGHDSDARLWVEMERRRCESGYMTAYLAWQGNEVCGAVSAADRGDLLRLKNLMVHPEWRRARIGLAVARFVADMASQSGLAAAGCFGLGYSTELYMKAGFVPVVEQVEWYKALTVGAGES